MNFDSLLGLGIMLFALSFVSLMSALIDGRRPYVAGIVVLCAVGMIGQAYRISPDGIQFTDIPNAYVNIAATFLR